MEGQVDDEQLIRLLQRNDLERARWKAFGSQRGGWKGRRGAGGEKRGCTKRGRVVENKGIRCRSVFSRGDNTIYRMRVEGNWGGSEVDRSGKK